MKSAWNVVTSIKKLFTVFAWKNAYLTKSEKMDSVYVKITLYLINLLKNVVKANKKFTIKSVSKSVYLIKKE